MNSIFQLKQFKELV